jgi:hypothetical protein
VTVFCGASLAPSPIIKSPDGICTNKLPSNQAIVVPDCGPDKDTGTSVGGTDAVCTEVGFDFIVAGSTVGVGEEAGEQAPNNTASAKNVQMKRFIRFLLSGRNYTLLETIHIQCNAESSQKNNG